MDKKETTEMQSGRVAKVCARDGTFSQRLEKSLNGKVLIVDDEPINQSLMMGIMKRFGLQAEVAGSGREALCMITEGNYSLVLMDVQMRGMSGIDVTEQIRLTEVENQSPRLPIVAITGNASSSFRDKCLYAGMDDFVTKPVKPEVLYNKLVPWLSFKKAVARGGDIETAPENDSTAQQLIWNKERALVLAGNDQRLLHDLIALYLERYPLLLERVEQSVSKQDGPQLRETAHAFKGAVTHFAAEESCSLSYDLEKMGSSGDMKNARIVFKKLRESIECLAIELRAYIGQ